MSATDRYKAIEQFKNMMDKKLKNDSKQVNENRCLPSQIKDTQKEHFLNEIDSSCK